LDTSTQNGIKGGNVRETIIALKNGDPVVLEGLVFVKDEGELQPGDLYIAERNTGPHLLTVKRVEIGAVFPTTPDYPFDIDECVKVQLVKNPYNSAA
jgi:hypothetical protein